MNRRNNSWLHLHYPRAIGNITFKASKEIEFEPCGQELDNIGRIESGFSSPKTLTSIMLSV